MSVSLHPCFFLKNSKVLKKKISRSSPGMMRSVERTSLLTCYGVLKILYNIISLYFFSICSGRMHSIELTSLGFCHTLWSTTKMLQPCLVKLFNWSKRDNLEESILGSSLTRWISYLAMWTVIFYANNVCNYVTGICVKSYHEPVSLCDLWWLIYVDRRKETSDQKYMLLGCSFCSTCCFCKVCSFWQVC